MSERLRAPQYDLIYHDIQSLKETGIIEVDTAMATIEPLIKDETIPVGPEHSFQSFPTLTMFDTVMIGSQKATDLHGVIAYKPSIKSASMFHRQADLVRTGLVAASFIDGSYTNRMTAVMGHALDVQQQWLQANNHGPFPFDPREYSGKKRNELIKQIVGDDWFYSDFGIVDWKAAASDAQSIMTHKITAEHTDSDREPLKFKLERLDNLLEFVSHPKALIFYRNAAIPAVYADAMRQIANYQDLDQEDRARRAAFAVFMHVMMPPNELVEDK